jgi:AcrR family transcriptional regulator
MSGESNSVDDRQRLPRAERRQQIVRAAATAFLGRGYSGTSMDDVARSAGVTRLIVYRIFDSKYELYSAVLGTVVDELTARVVQADNASQPVSHRVMSVARADPDAFRLLWRHALHEPDFTDLAALFRNFADDYGEQLLRPYMRDPLMLPWAARSVSSYLFESVCLWLDLGTPERDDDAAAALAVSIRAMIASW